MDLGFLRKKLHYAWIVCFGCVLMFFCTCGLSCNVFTVYQPFMIEEFGFTQTQVGLLNTIRTFANMTSLLFLNVFYRKLNLRKGLLIAAMVTVSGYLVYAVSRTYALFVLGQILVGLGYGLSCMVPLSMLLERWFAKDRTLAVSICSAASGMATVGIPGLITASVEKNGLNRTFLIEALVMLVMNILSFLILRDTPEGMNLHPFGEEAQAADAVSAEEGGKKAEKKKAEKKKAGLSYKALLPAFFMMFLMGGVCGPGWANVSLLASTGGYSSAAMATAITCMGLALMLGKFAFGIMSEKFTLYKTTELFHIVLIAGGLMLSFSGLSILLLFAGAFLYGGALGMITVGQVCWCNEWAVPEQQGAVKRYFSLLYTIGSMTHSVLCGVAADAFGSYKAVYLYFTACSVVTMLIVAYLYKKTNNAQQL